MTCKDCLHYEACIGLLEAIDVIVGEEHEKNADKCSSFKNKLDFAKIVMCKDCRYNGSPESLKGAIWCRKHSFYLHITPTDFCSCGKRKEE